MTTHRLPSNFLSDPSDEVLIAKAAKGMGSILAGSPLVQRLAKAAERIVVCKSGHEQMVGKIDSVVKCKCGAPWAVVKGEKEEDETEPTYERAVKSTKGLTPVGTLDGEQLYTDTRKARRPFTGSR